MTSGTSPVHIDAKHLSPFPTSPPALDPAASAGQHPTELREAFNDFVGQTFYGEMLKAMRKTVDEPAYFHGGRGEEVFQNQLDQILIERVSDATASQITGPMFELFTATRVK